MPHGARAISASGYYHVVPKGIANQILFENDADRSTYLSLLFQAVTQYKLRLHAYCLMSNHVHLIIEDQVGALSEAMKYIDERYGAYYAHKIGRTGGVFRKPFWSEPINDDNRLLCAVRYTHNNPVAAGICRASDYAWSSVSKYLGKLGACDEVTYTGTVLSLLGGRKGFIEFSRADAATALPFEGSKLRFHLKDDEAIRLAVSIIGHDPRTGTTTDDVRLLKKRGFSQAQITRITGLGANQVRRA